MTNYHNIMCTGMLLGLLSLQSSETSETAKSKKYAIIYIGTDENGEDEFETQSIETINSPKETSSSTASFLSKRGSSLELFSNKSSSKSSSQSSRQNSIIFLLQSSPCPSPCPSDFSKSSITFSKHKHTAGNFIFLRNILNSRPCQCIEAVAQIPACFYGAVHAMYSACCRTFIETCPEDI